MGALEVLQEPRLKGKTLLRLDLWRTCNMYRNTRFAEILKGLSKGSIDRIVSTHNADKFNKGFDFWDHLIAMLYNQLSGCRSLRELENSFNDQRSHHYHLNTHEIKRSTLSDANSNRNPQPFAELVSELMQVTHRKLRREIKQLLYVIDSSPIQLRGLGYDDWTLNNRTRKNQGLKLHLQYDLKKQLPVYVNLTAPTINDCVDVRHIQIEKNATYIVDKGYCDYSWWYEINQSDAYFVTRLKRNAALAVDQSLDILADDQWAIQADEIFHLTNSHPGGQRRNPYVHKPLRRVTVHRDDKTSPLVLVTNDMTRSAGEIADLYKARWSIELFFKWLKQNLKIKRFLGRSKNSVKIQIYTAIIAYLLLAIHKANHQIATPLYQLLATLRTSIFARAETEDYLYRKRKEHRKMLRRLQPELIF